MLECTLGYIYIARLDESCGFAAEENACPESPVTYAVGRVMNLDQFFKYFGSVKEKLLTGFLRYIGLVALQTCAKCKVISVPLGYSNCHVFVTVIVIHAQQLAKASENSMQIGVCSSPGCYTKRVKSSMPK